MNMKPIFSIILLLAFAGSSFAQRFSNRGKDFWTGYGLHYFMELGQGNNQEMVLYFSAEEKATVTVTTKGISASETKTYNVPANSVISSDPMPKSGVLDCRLYGVPISVGGLGSDRLFDQSIHIESDVPIVAYAHISGASSSGATMLMPVESWGYSYLSVNSQQSIYGNAGGDGCFSWIFVVADHDNTVVEITPSVKLRNGKPANVAFNAVLNKGQIYQLVGEAIDKSTGRELTGTKVKSVANNAGKCYPVAVFAGSSSTAITCNGSNAGAADNLIQQIFPVQAWGKTYLTAPFSSSGDATVLNPGIFRIAVKDPATVIKRNGVPLTGLINNCYYQYQSTSADYIEADKPILVTQYIPSMSDPVLNTGCNYVGLGDPEMVYLSPIEQAINRVGFYRNTEAIVEVNYVTLIIPTGGLPSLTIDGAGSSSFSYIYPHPNLPGYTVVVKRWPAAKAQCIIKSDSAFTSVTYGLGSFDSYAYNGGTMINNLNGTLSLHNQDGAPGAVHNYTCINSPVELSILSAYQPTKLVWHLSQLAFMAPNADITQPTPVSSGTVVVKGITYYRYTLPDAYRFSKAGNFRFTVSSTNPALDNCDNTEDILLDIDVKSINPSAAFKYTTALCLSDSVHFEWDKSAAAGNVINKWLWTFPEGPLGVKDTATRAFSSYGTKNVTLRVTNQDGCSGDTTMSVEIDPPAVMGIQASLLEVCQGGTIDFTAIVATPGTIPVDGWYWDFGNKQTSSLQNPSKIKYDTTGPLTVKLVGKLGTACTTDTASVVVSINPAPSAAFSYPAGCLPASGIVTFKDKSSSADGSPITGYTWNFGDPDATTANPNTSVLAEPDHTFKVGNYSILHSVTNQKGCTKDTVVKTSFSIAPTLVFGALPEVCENGNKFLLTQVNVTNGVAGSGYYKGDGVDALSYFTPSVAKSGPHTIKYVFTTSGGCIDSVSAVINVLPAPQAAFNVTEGVCLGDAVTIEDNSQVLPGGGALTSWSWSLGDGTMATYANKDPFTKIYAADGKDTIGLVVTDIKGCISNKVLKVVTIHPLPEVGFNLPAVVCMPDGVAQFKSNTSIKDNTPLTYEWNFGDGSSPSSAVDPSHAYLVANSYNVSLKVTSAFGCSMSSDDNFSSFVPAPRAGFTSANAVCQNAPITFTDASSPESGTLTKWSWNFGDGSVADAASPEKTFTTAGIKTVTLTVTNSEGCFDVSDPKQVEVYLQPVIDAGGPFNVAQGTTVTFNPVVNSSSLIFKWTPSDKLNNPDIQRPSYIANENKQFFLTATSGANNCTATDSVMVKILLPVKIPNAFTPNGDGINDTWVITNLSTYSGCTLQVFNRYGQQVFISYGYPAPWNGKINGNAIPVGVYYYIIDLKNGFGKMTGSVTILK